MLNKSKNMKQCKMLVSYVNLCYNIPDIIYHNYQNSMAAITEEFMKIRNNK